MEKGGSQPTDNDKRFSTSFSHSQTNNKVQPCIPSLVIKSAVNVIFLPFNHLCCSCIELANNRMKSELLAVLPRSTEHQRMHQ